VSQPALRPPVPVGKYFLDAGKITQMQLDLALEHRTSFKLKLGQSLVELGFVTEADMVEALRHQARFPCIHLTGGIVDARVAAKVGEVVSRRLRAIALNQIAGHTTVALEDPSDAEALAELQHILATRIFPVYAEPSAIQKNLDRVFGHRGAPPGGAQSGTQSGAQTGAPSGAPSGTPSAAPEARRPAPGAAQPAAPEEGAPDERAVVEKVRAFLHLAFEQGASSIHLETRGSELVVRTRVDGLLREHSRLPAVWARPTIACLKSLAKLEDGETEVPQEGSVPFLFKKQHVEVRVATTPSLLGESAVLHVLGRAQERRELAQLGLVPEQLKELESLLATRGGLMLVAGPAASGRSTTALALLERLAGPERKVIALATHTVRELPGVLHVQVEPQGDVAAAVLRLQRQDPDVLFVPEAGERECAHAILEVALAGCGVLAGLRAGGALEALLRCLHLGLEPYLLADALRGIVAQRLVRRICPDCRTPIVPDEALRARLGLVKDEATYHEGQGCDACQGTGYRGRMGLFEVLTTTPGLRRELETGASAEALLRAARADGFKSLREHGLALARAGTTTLHEVLANTGGS
jgi:type II secretory ATPase GspE/PulE/Tfp pilus assembly ATPase PilB-like protein